MSLAKERVLAEWACDAISQAVRADTRAKNAEARLDYLVTQYKTLLEIHAHVVMDTPEDRELHDRAVATMREALSKVTGDDRG